MAAKDTAAELLAQARRNYEAAAPQRDPQAVAAALAEAQEHKAEAEEAQR